MSVDRTAPEPLDRSQTIDKNLLDYMQEAVARYPNRPAYSQRGQTLSFQEIDRLSERFAAFLQNHPQLKSGDRIAVQLPNVLSYPLVAFGILKAGMVLVNVNPLYTDYETLKQLRDADIKGWICIETSAYLISTIRQELDIPLVVISGVFDLHDFPKRHLYSYILRRHLHLVKPYDAKDTIPLRQALRAGRSQSWHRPALGPHTLAMIQYTGGSTGVLKGAMLTHGNIVANMEQVSCFLGSEVQLGSEVVIAPLPIYHIFAFTVHCVTPLITGSHNVLIMDPTQIHALIREMRRWSFTSISGVNTLFYSLLRADSFKKLNFSTLRFAIAGGMKLDPKLAESWESLTGRPILEGFGMTELSPVASFNPPQANRLGTIGKALPGTELRLVDATGHTIDRCDTPGELWVRGPQVMQGYWRQPEETARHLTPDGWMRTGDLATFDADGYWRIVGRIKRMILVSGFNVYPQEIEEVLSRHPGILACRALGVPHSVSGEVVKVLVIAKDKTLKAQDIRDYCRRFLTTYKIPKHIEFTETLPPLPATYELYGSC